MCKYHSVAINDVGDGSNLVLLLQNQLNCKFQYEVYDSL